MDSVIHPLNNWGQVVLVLMTRDLAKYKKQLIDAFFSHSLLLHQVKTKETITAGLSLRAGGRGFSPATTSLSPGYFDTKRKYWKEKNASN